jgi:hypothetical protein
LAELRGLADRIERWELSALGPGDRALLKEVVEAEIAERRAAIVEEASTEGWGGDSSSGREPPLGPFGFFAWWMARR